MVDLQGSITVEEREKQRVGLGAGWEQNHETAS